MKKLRILVLAMLSCALLSFVACNNNAGSDDNGGGSSGGGSASLAPFAGTTWINTETREDDFYMDTMDIIFANDGSATLMGLSDYGYEVAAVDEGGYKATAWPKVDGVVVKSSGAAFSMTIDSADATQGTYKAADTGAGTTYYKAPAE